MRWDEYVRGDTFKTYLYSTLQQYGRIWKALDRISMTEKIIICDQHFYDTC